MPLEGYCKLYRRLKEKYGPPLIEVARAWPSSLTEIATMKLTLFLCTQNWPETTDPQKFVYEDIAIATYLLVRSNHLPIFTPSNLIASH